jgi:hypothetical protein
MREAEVSPFPTVVLSRSNSNSSAKSPAIFPTSAF